MSLDVITKLKTSPKIKNISVTEEKKLLIKWSKVEGAEKYAVKRAVSDEGEFEHIAWCKKTEYIDEDVKEDITYRYKIMAHKKLEGKKASTKLSAVKAMVISDIKAPENLVAESEKGPVIKLRWEKNCNANEYIINRRNDFYSQILPVARTSDCFFTDKKIVSGQAYHYSVQAIIKDGENEKQGNFSNEVHAVNLNAGQILEVKALTRKRVCLTLRIITGADSYCVERSEHQEGPWQEIYRSKNALEYQITDKVPKVFINYFYRVRALKIVDGKEYFGGYCKIVRVKSR